jgi:hypothetical protein
MARSTTALSRDTKAGGLQRSELGIISGFSGRIIYRG